MDAGKGGQGAGKLADWIYSQGNKAVSLEGIGTKR
jgi:hypothetical protein